MKLAIVVLLAAVALVAAADADTESEVVSEHFGSSDGMVKAHVVQSVKLFLNPNAAVVAKTVKHLPSHSNANANADANAEEGENRIIGNVFETSNFEAQEVESEADAEEEASFAEVDAEAETEEAEPSIPKSAPIAKLKASLIKAEAAAVVPDMTLPPHNAPTDANAPLNAVQPLSGSKPVAVMDEAAEKASHLYIGYEGPELPTGLEIKRPIDTSGTIGTEAGTKFNFNKKQIKGAKCANGCQLKVPVMVGYRGVKEWPAESTRNVRMPGDRENWRHIHEDLETPKGTSWYKPDLHSAGRHIKKVTRKLGKFRRTRKAYEDTALNRRVVVPQYDKPDY